METAQYEVITLVGDEYPCSMSDETLAECFSNKFVNNICKFLSSGHSGRNYRCHNYAFDNEYLNFYTAIDYLRDNYKQINIYDIKKDDVVTYYDYRGDITHYGIIWETNNTIRGTLMRSKWGTMGIFETDLYSVPDCYGTIVKFWRKK